MLVLVNDRELVSAGYKRSFSNEGVASTSVSPDEFGEWIAAVAGTDLMAVEGFLIGECSQRLGYPRLVRGRSRAPLVAINDNQILEQTLDLFNAGFDDVVRKPAHARELLARMDAVRRRSQPGCDDVSLGDIRVFFDGRDPEVHGEALQLPRRERRILEYLARNRGRRISKTQIFNAIYGIYDEQVEENVVESHISKLRKKLREKLGYDLIESKRYLGYCLDDRSDLASTLCPAPSVPRYGAGLLQVAV